MNQRINRPTFLFQLTLGLALLLGSVACTPVGVNNLADIQRTFSETASKDNQFDQNLLSKTSTQDLNSASLDSVSISIGYASVLEQLNKLPKEQINSFKTAGLWGNVLMLKAMSQWRLQKYVAALETLQALDKKTYAALGNRDKVMYHIIPGLIKNDEFYQQLKQAENHAPTAEVVNNIQQGFSSVLTTFNAALDTSMGNQQMRRYLLISYLGAYKNSQDACQLSPADQRRACMNHKRCDAFANYVELEKSLDTATGSTNFLKHVREHWVGKPNAQSLKKAYERCQAKD